MKLQVQIVLFFGVLLFAVGPPALSNGTIPPPACASDGHRIQVLYVYIGTPESIDGIAWVANEADIIFDRSAHKTGGHRHLRYATNPDCSLSIVSVQADSEMNLAELYVFLKGDGFNNHQRKYLAFVSWDPDRNCGHSLLIHDDQPGLDNRNNHTAGYMIIHRRCWLSDRSVAHEIIHSLGGVQNSSPNSSGEAHVTDAGDVMASGNGDNPLTFPCDFSQNELLDCNEDDYFNLNPAQDSYLATHWNIADSPYLTDYEMRVFFPQVQTN